MNKRLYNIGIMIGAFGIIILLVLIFSGEAYPSILFKMLAPIGLSLTFIGVIISFIGWLLMIKDAIEEKAGLDVKGLIFIGIIMFLIPILKSIFSN